LEDQLLAQLLLEYGFVTEEQLEAAFSKQKELPEKRTLSQILIQDEIISVRALKTAHASAQRRKETQFQEEALRRRFETRKLKTKQLIRTEAVATEKPREPQMISFGTPVKGVEPQDSKTFKPVTLMSLKEDLDHLIEEVRTLKEDVWFLKGAFKHELMGELLKQMHEEIKKLGR